MRKRWPNRFARDVRGGGRGVQKLSKTHVLEIWGESCFAKGGKSRVIEMCEGNSRCAKGGKNTRVVEMCEGDVVVCKNVAIHMC